MVYARKKYSLHWLNFMLAITNKSLKLRNMGLLNGAFQKSKNPLGLASTSLRSELTKPQWIFGFLKSPI